MEIIVFLDNEEFTKNYDIKKNEKIVLDVKSNDDFSSLDDYTRDFISLRNFYNPYWLQEWALNTKIKDGKTIMDFFNYKGQSLWYFYEYIIFAGSIMIPYNSSTNVLYYIDAVYEVIKREKPKKIVIQNSDSLLYKIVIDICKLKKIPFEVLGINSKVNVKTKLYENMFLLRRFIQMKLRMRQILGKRIKKNYDKGKPDILFLSNPKFLRDGVEKSSFYSSVTEGLDEKGDISYNMLEYDDFWELSSSLKKMSNRHLKNDYNNIKYIGKYYDKDVFKKINEVVDFSLNVWRQICESRVFKKSLVYRDVNIHSYLEKRFELAFTVFSYFIGDTIAISEAVLKKERPKMLVMDHEVNYYALGFLYNSKKYNFKTIALQYEAVNQRSSIHRRIDSKKILDKKSHLWRPLPDIKCASGEIAEKILIEDCNYPKEIIKITGQASFDTLAERKKIKVSKKIYDDFNLNKDKKLIVYASKFDEKEINIWKEVKKTVRENKDLQVVFKLAPSNNFDRIKSLIGEENRVKVMKDINLYDLLSICDLFISVRSMTIIEAMSLGKPVMLVDYNNTAHFPFVKYGAAAQAYDISATGSKMLEILSDKKIRDELVKNADKFLYGFLNGADGKATERIVKLLR
ncbi:MAG: glycosyltransferase, partial [Nanoarchaeota archaeon]|nr:glycosyltransferase [Nanoarchaeota archaeon]